MRTSFPGYYPISEPQLSALWCQATFTFDASSLLNLYRYSDETRKEFFQAIERVRNRLWLTHQAAHEFQRNRFSVIEKQIRTYSECESKIKEIVTILESKIHPFVGNESLHQFEAAVSALEEDLKKGKTVLEGWKSADPIQERLTVLFDGRVGPPIPPSETSAWEREGQARFEKRVPPGYRDQKKEGVGQFGDYFIWRQILEKAKAEGLSIILMTDDEKEDWWAHDTARNRLGPEPQLRQEFSALTGRECHLYSSERFLTGAEKYLGQVLKPETVEEVRRVAKGNLQPRAIGRSVFLPSTLDIISRAVEAERALSQFHSPTLAGLAAMSGAGYAHIQNLVEQQQEAYRLLDRLPTYRPEYERLAPTPAGIAHGNIDDVSDATESPEGRTENPRSTEGNAANEIDSAPEEEPHGEE